MASHNMPQGTIDAARAILAEATRLNVHQVHEIILRDMDANQEKPKILHLIPLGATLGVAITNDGEAAKDEDILFVAMSALGNSLPALGFTARTPTTYIIAPEDAT